MADKDIERIRAKSALEVVRQHPVLMLFAVSPALVALGVDLAKINTIGDLQGGLEEAERLLGYKVVPVDESPKPHQQN